MLLDGGRARRSSKKKKQGKRENRESRGCEKKAIDRSRNFNAIDFFFLAFLHRFPYLGLDFLRAGQLSKEVVDGGLVGHFSESRKRRKEDEREVIFLLSRR